MQEICREDSQGYPENSDWIERLTAFRASMHSSQLPPLMAVMPRRKPALLPTAPTVWSSRNLIAVFLTLSFCSTCTPCVQSQI